MAAEQVAGAMSPIMAFAVVGVLGVGSQWLAWRLRLPAIVLMLAAGILVGPVLGLFDPARDIGPLTGPLISLAVAVILFEGGLTLDFHELRDARHGVRRLVVIGAPLGWLLSTLTLRYGAGLGWESATVFGGIMVVTGPTVIAPLLRQARLSRRPAQLLQWEAIVNDPIGALAAVLALEVVLTLRTSEQLGHALWTVAFGVAIAAIIGLAVGFAISRAFWRNRVPEFMKVPVLFVALIACFALADTVLHESGLLAVTVMGLVIANSDLPSFVELRRFKEHATILLVSGVFILLAASLDFAMVQKLSWRTIVFVLAVVLIARPLTVLLSLVGTDLPRKERLLIALTGPRGVVLVAVAGLFGGRLAEAGVADGDLVAPLAFALVVFTVVLHGFTFAPLARWLGLSAAEAPGVLLVGGSRFTTGLAEVLKKAGVEVLISDPNHAHLIRPRALGIRTFYGDILSEAAEHQVELLSYETLLAATDNDAYNTLVATDFAPEFGRDRTWQIGRAKSDKSRHALPTQLGGRPFAAGRTHDALDGLIEEGWSFRATKLSEEFAMADWREKRPDAILLGTIGPKGTLRLLAGDKDPDVAAGHRLVFLLPPGTAVEEPAPAA
ncbi:MAG: sodium:proton antiporter [Defluviimonas denitrificans]